MKSLSRRPNELPPHLPPNLTITLWDFSWYVRTGPGEPFEDLDLAVAQAVERGYNTIRICAMPFLLFGSGMDTSAVTLGPLGGEYAQRVRWYDVKQPTTIDARTHLLALFEACRRHDVYVIVSSWEYQQSSSFASTDRWWRALEAVPPEDRAERLAEAHAALVDLLSENGLCDRVAFVELHNEVQSGHLTDGLPDDGHDHVAALLPRLQRGIDRFHELRSDIPVTVNYAHVPAGSMRFVPDRLDVLIFHPYVYGVLNETTAAFDLRGDLASFPETAVRALGILRADAPAPLTWVLEGEDAWRMDATIVGKPEIYLHDWVVDDAFDRFLYERYQLHVVEMQRVLQIWIDVAADEAARRGVPLVFGEGWIGYTPLGSAFEGGPVGAEFCRLAARESRRVGAWGTIVCSNAAPHHPMWQDVDLQRECNDLFVAAEQVD